MRVHFDLNNQECTFEYMGETHVLKTHTVPIGQYWTCAFASGVIVDETKYCIAWKSWMQLEQFIEVQQFRPDKDQEPWQTIATWSYISKPQPGTSQTSRIKHSGCGGTVEVIGSPFGDWNNKEYP